MAVEPRLIPCLLLKGEGLVKTVKFEKPNYIGDPRNAVKIFNEKEVDELALFDIYASQENRDPQFELIEEIVTEAFMPVAYGGGIKSIDHVAQLFSIGVEKVVITSSALDNINLVRDCAQEFGSQSIAVCIDVKKSILGGYGLRSHGGKKKHSENPVQFAKKIVEEGAGELMVNCIDRDGMMKGYDIPFVRSITSQVGVPVIACGGAGKLDDMVEAVKSGGAAAAAAGSIFVYQGRHRAVLISYPERTKVRSLWGI